MTRLLALDLHAHVNVELDGQELTSLDAVVFAVTRSLDEARKALERHDPNTVWGVGCHPGLVRAHRDFSTGEFAGLLRQSAFAAELGLDGASRVPMETQRTTLRAALAVLETMPRIVSLHSYMATDALIEELSARPIEGAILHWWLGDAQLTARAVELGCFFSINDSSLRRRDLLRIIPRERILTETDHPFGDRRSSAPQRPGAIQDLEESLSEFLRVSPEHARGRVWTNFAGLVSRIGCGELLPDGVRAQLAELPAPVIESQPL